MKNGNRTFVVALLIAGWSACLARDLPADIKQAIQDLGHAQYKVRVAAVQHLESLAETNHEAVLKACWESYRQTLDPEVRWRAKTVLRHVVDKYLFRAPRAFLGVQLNNVIVAGGGKLVINGLTMPAGAVWITRVVPDTAAQQAGLQPNDFILDADSRRFEGGPADFTTYVKSKLPGEKMKLTVVRGQETNVIEAVLGKMPETEQEKLYTGEASEEFFNDWLRRQPAPPKRRAK
jgi:hypothetical protein